MGAISLNGFVGMTLMHPVQWHVRNIDDVRAEKAREKKQRLEEVAVTNHHSTIHSKTKWSSLQSLKEESGTDMPLLTEKLKVT